MAKRKIMIVTVVLLMLLQFAVFPSFAAGLDPYVGFDAWLISSYQCTQASFPKTENWAAYGREIGDATVVWISAANPPMP